MEESISKIIRQKRRDMGLTLTRLADRFGVSAPAIHKFERGQMTPSFDLWMKMAAHFDLSEPEAVLLWVQAKLPLEHQQRITIKESRTGKQKAAGAKSGHTDHSRIVNRDELRQIVKTDKAMPAGLRAMVKDDEIWKIYKPTGREIDLLRDFYERYGEGTKNRFREALRLLRDFSGHDG